MVGVFCLSSFAVLTQVKAVDVNLGTMPLEWGFYFDNGGTAVTYGSNPQITWLDSGEEHTPGTPSIRIDTRNIQNPGRELDWTGNGSQGYHIAVAPGDVIEFSCWIKTEPNETTLNPGINWHGGYIGFDMYHDLNRIWEYGSGSTTWQSGFTYTNFDYVVNYTHVDYGSDWTQLTMTATIPSKVFTNDDYNTPLGGSYQVNYIIPWISMRWLDTTETASGWFADAVIYKNPTPSPTPTPTATPTPTIPPPGASPGPIPFPIEGIITADNFFTNFNQGEQLAIQDTLRVETIVFNVTHNSLQGTSSLNVNSASGTFTIQNVNPCDFSLNFDNTKLRVTANNALVSPSTLYALTTSTYVFHWVSGVSPALPTGSPTTAIPVGINFADLFTFVIYGLIATGIVTLAIVTYSASQKNARGK